MKKINPRSLPFSGVSAVLLCCLSVASTQAARADNANATAANDNFQYWLSDTYMYDTNVFRLPSGITQADLPSLPPNFSKDDRINRASVGTISNIFAGRQEFSLDLELDNNRFDENTEFNNNSGDAKGLWNYQLGNDLSGKISADYERSLAGFANTRFFNKDMLTQQTYYADFKEKVSPRWSLTGGINEAKTTHSASERDIDNGTSTTYKLGVAYDTPSLNQLGYDYSYARARYPNDSSGLEGESLRDYHDETGIFWLKYTVSPKTYVEGQLGYLRRDYEHTSTGNFSGSTGRFNFQWQPTTRTQLAVSAWHELQAYVEVGSEYFVSDGVSISPTYLATDKLQISAILSHERHDYKGDNAPVVQAGVQFSARNDDVNAAQITVGYAVSTFADVSLSYRHESRQSNYAIEEYSDSTLMLAVKLHF